MSLKPLLDRCLKDPAALDTLAEKVAPMTELQAAHAWVLVLADLRKMHSQLSPVEMGLYEQQLRAVWRAVSPQNEVGDLCVVQLKQVLARVKGVMEGGAGVDISGDLKSLESSLEQVIQSFVEREGIDILVLQGKVDELLRKFNEVGALLTAGLHDQSQEVTGGLKRLNLNDGDSVHLQNLIDQLTALTLAVEKQEVDVTKAGTEAEKVMNLIKDQFSGFMLDFHNVSLISSQIQKNLEITQKLKDTESTNFDKLTVALSTMVATVEQISRNVGDKAGGSGVDQRGLNAASIDSATDQTWNTLMHKMDEMATELKLLKDTFTAAKPIEEESQPNVTDFTNIMKIVNEDVDTAITSSHTQYTNWHSKFKKISAESTPEQILRWTKACQFWAHIHDALLLISTKLEKKTNLTEALIHPKNKSSH